MWSLTMLLVRVLVNSRLLVDEFWGSQKLQMDWLFSLTSTLFKDQLHFILKIPSCSFLNKYVKEKKKNQNKTLLIRLNQLAQRAALRIPSMPSCFKFQDLFTFSSSSNLHINPVWRAGLVLLPSRLEKLKVGKTEWFAHRRYRDDGVWELSLKPLGPSFFHGPAVRLRGWCNEPHASLMRSYQAQRMRRKSMQNGWKGYVLLLEFIDFFSKLYFKWRLNWN